MTNHAYITLSVEFDRIHSLLTNEEINWNGKDKDRQMWQRKLVEVQKGLETLNKIAIVNQ